MQKGLFVSTELFEPSLRDEAWREITRPFFDVTPGTGVDEITLEGSLKSQPIGTLLIGPTTYNFQQYNRNRRIILQSGLDHYLLQLFLAGTLKGDCDGRAISARPGDIGVFDLARPFMSGVSPGSTISVMLPRERVDKASGGRSLHGLVLKAGDTFTRLLANFITSLSSMASEMSDAEVLAIEEPAINLLAAGIARREVDWMPEESALAQILRQRILEFIDANLSMRELGPDFLLHYFRVSRAHLYRMFAVDGGVATVVRDRRLDAAYRDLVRASGPVRSITEIALDLGFSSSGQFSRAFRERFSVTPSEARQERSLLPLVDLRISGLQTHFAMHSQKPGGL
ncbi:MAG: helix-turn-helix domain-containing protein [Rhodanobacter sp.]